jgi:DsbC/DsbD-like thiol-disulfide interchange protein
MSGRVHDGGNSGSHRKVRLLMITIALRCLLWCIAAVAVVAQATPSYATDSSSWDGDARSAVRLIAGGSRPSDQEVHAGLEMRLSPGWKTYWRYPGDSGVPPRFNFAQSLNVKSVNVSWPAPDHFVDEGGQSIGYKDSVIFPIQITPEDPAKPVTLRLALDYAVCEKLCVPARGEAELLLSGGVSSLAPLVEAAEARVPKRVRFGEGTVLAIQAVHRETLDGRQRVVVDTKEPGSDPVELYAEGPTPEWALPLPEAVSAAPPGLRRFAFDLDGLPPGASADGAVLTLTLVAGKSAIEVTAPLD